MTLCLNTFLLLNKLLPKIVLICASMSVFHFTHPQLFLATYPSATKVRKIVYVVLTEAKFFSPPSLCYRQRTVDF